jgi:hypothetical protein
MQKLASALAFLVYAIVAGSSVWSQESEVGKRCDLAVFGLKDAKAFLVFDRDLREAIEKQDAGKIALLVQYPLRVTDDRSQIFIHDGRSLQGRFAQIFTPAIRRAILSTTRDTIWCNYTGINYGDTGQVWVNVTDKGFFLMTVNLPNSGSSASPNERVVEIACHTDQQQIVIDRTQKGEPRFRSWKLGRSISGPPDLQIEAGSESIEGTGPCARRIWTFQTTITEMRLEEPGCYGDDNLPPHGAQAEFFSTNPTNPSDSEHKEQKGAWCF